MPRPPIKRIGRSSIQRGTELEVETLVQNIFDGPWAKPPVQASIILGPPANLSAFFKSDTSSRLEVAFVPALHALTFLVFWKRQDLRLVGSEGVETNAEESWKLGHTGQETIGGSAVPISQLPFPHY